MPQYVNLDSGESIFFTRELETIRARTYDVQFEEPKLFNIIPKSMEGDPLATDITHRSYTRVGMAKMGGTEYATDFPRVDVYGVETTVKVKPVHSGYGYNKDEIARAAKVGRPLEAMRASAARKAIEMKLDEIARSGEATTGLKGLYNASGVSDYTIPDGTGGKSDWAHKTADEILADLYGAVNYVLTSTNGIEVPDTMALPMGEYLRISQKKIATDSEGATVLNYFLKNTPYIKNIIWLPGLDTAGGSGSWDGTQMGLVWKNSADKLVFDLPMPFNQEDLLQDGLNYSVPCRAKTAGVTVFYPKSICTFKGI